MTDPGSESRVEAEHDDTQDAFSMTDIYFVLLNDLSELSDLVEKAKGYAVENHPGDPWSSYVRRFKKEESSSYDLQSTYKKSVAQSVSGNIGTLKQASEPLYSANVSLELKEKLTDAVTKERCRIEQLKAQLLELQISTRELDRKSDELKKLISNRKVSGEMAALPNFNEISKRINEQRKKLVRDIRYVVEKSCPNSNVDGILADALSASQTVGEQYINVAECEEVEFLLRCNLLQRHPHERQLVRLQNLLE